jgi:hypothetical protein
MHELFLLFELYFILYVNIHIILSASNQLCTNRLHSEYKQPFFNWEIYGLAMI